MTAAAPKKRRLTSFANDKAAKKRERAAAAAAYDAMFIHGKRPLVRPTSVPVTRERTAGELALARDIRSGAYKPGGCAWDEAGFVDTSHDEGTDEPADEIENVAIDTSEAGR